MEDTQILVSSRDSLLVAVPFILILFMTLFRLDQIIAKPKELAKRRHPVSGTDEFGEPVVRDPDGRLAPCVKRRSPSQTS